MRSKKIISQLFLDFATFIPLFLIHRVATENLIKYQRKNISQKCNQVTVAAQEHFSTQVPWVIFQIRWKCVCIEGILSWDDCEQLKCKVRERRGGDNRQLMGLLSQKANIHIKYEGENAGGGWRVWFGCWVGQHRKLVEI